MKSILVGEVAITERDFPNLYQMAKKDPELLLIQLEGLMKATGADSLAVAATNYEIDLSQISGH